MDEITYINLVFETFDKLEGLQKQRESLDAEIMKLQQFISATANLLPDDMRDATLARLQSAQELQRVRDTGLTEAVQTVLKSAEDAWLTVAQVRDKLFILGFDFSLYSTNPLASISAILRRTKPTEVETKNSEDGVAMFRWKAKKPRMVEAFEKARRGGLTPPPLPPEYEESTLADRITSRRGGLIPKIGEK